MSNSAAEELKEAMRKHQAGDFTGAEAIYRRLLEKEPSNADALNLLGMLRRHFGCAQEAVELIRRAIALRPAANYYNSLGNALADLGRKGEAVEAFRAGLRLNEKLPSIHNNLGTALRDLGRLDEAIDHYRRAIELQPESAEAHRNLGMALGYEYRPDEAVAAFREAIRLKPDFSDAYNGLGVMLKDQGLIEEAIEAYREALRVHPDFHEAHSNLLCTLYLHESYSGEAIFTEAIHWAQRHGDKFKAAWRVHANDRTSDRRLRVGYVSADFREHPVGHFMLPLLANHDHAQFEIVCYSDTATEDAASAQLRGHADRWERSSGLAHAVLAERIRADEIDILVDLAQHTEGSRLLAFARKPAPVQVTYLGFLGTSGLAAMDYRLSDPYLDPPGMHERHYVERLVHLEKNYWCYQRHAQTPDPGPLPLLRNGYITFGCLNNFCKISPGAVRTWCELLRTVANSRLVLHADPGSHRQRLRDVLASAGIRGDRVEFVGKMTLLDYLKMYQDFDIALDPFPYNGGTTTCDALWMGVPVVTLAGATAVGRAGVSLLSNLGLEELIASTSQEYVRLASELASQERRLAALRGGLRQKMVASPLCDASGFARQVEKVYRQMWSRWCDGSAA